MINSPLPTATMTRRPTTSSDDQDRPDVFSPKKMCLLLIVLFIENPLCIFPFRSVLLFSFPFIFFTPGDFFPLVVVTI